jgi:hypothetical protein
MTPRLSASDWTNRLQSSYLARTKDSNAESPHVALPPRAETSASGSWIIAVALADPDSQPDQPDHTNHTRPAVPSLFTGRVDGTWRASCPG